MKKQWTRGRMDLDMVAHLKGNKLRHIIIISSVEFFLTVTCCKDILKGLSLVQYDPLSPSLDLGWFLPSDCALLWHLVSLLFASSKHPRSKSNQRASSDPTPPPPPSTLSISHLRSLHGFIRLKSQITPSKLTHTHTHSGCGCSVNGVAHGDIAAPFPELSLNVLSLPSPKPRCGAGLHVCVHIV